MFQVINHLTTDHDWRLVALAVAVCILASAVAISMVHRAQSTNGRGRLIWVSLDAAAAGCGIWATHFIAMLAYGPASSAGYDLALTVLSLLIAVLVTGSGFALAILEVRRWTWMLGGAVGGAGIAAMHYTGMAALQLPGRIAWSPTIVLASVLIGIAFGVGAAFFAVRRDTWANTSTSVAFLVLAILAMHFTGMAAIVFTPDQTLVVSELAFSPSAISLVIAGVTVTVLGMCQVAAMSDRRWKGTLRQQKILLDSALENLSQGLCMFDRDGRVMLHNQRYAIMTGLSPGNYVGRSLLDLLKQREETGAFTEGPEERFAMVMAEMRAGKPNSRTVKVYDRTLRVVESPKQGGGWIATFEDITEWLKIQNKIAHMAHHDALTDLANRGQLVKYLEEALAGGPGRADGVALHFIDLDHFKSVNDRLGHDAGDHLLKVMAERLRAAAHEGDLVARLGGDEFVVIQTGIMGKDQAVGFSRRLNAAMAAPIAFNEQKIVATVSVGIALAPADGTTPEALLKSADLALYKAKDDGRNCTRYFKPEMDAALRRRIELEGMIRSAVLLDGFELHYQPQYKMSDRKLIGFEALVRMRADDGGLIPPSEFIPIAESLGLIDKIGAWVLNEACRTAVSWPQDLTVAVNLSPAEFKSGEISHVVARALEAAGLAPHRLELEITEALLLDDSEAAMAELNKLKKMGIAIVMDDFGTGHSSLSFLWKFPFDKIKIDRSFMAGFDGSTRNAETVVKTIIALGRELKMQVTVEGVETAKQAAFLDTADSDQAQGFYFGHPVPAADLGAILLSDYKRTISPSPPVAFQDQVRRSVI
ncbi:MAG: EAL domain-containing protein [Pseudolabrys sp.]|nr:EAL domain-containing protein [Pseudolabrys sp.]